MTQPTLGSADGRAIAIDVDRLVQSRLLIQGASGAGKSGAVRRLLEQTHGKIQHLVIDPEGEYATLRERFDYVLAGKGGDCPADVRSAELLTRRLLELGASAIIDLHEMPTRERPRFVRIVCETLVDAPRALWHDALVVIEEIHLFAPQGGREAESTNAVIDLGTRGRKRGYALVAVTQRISDLHKSVVAQCGNRLIGRTTLDTDVKRAAYELGFAPAQARQLAELRTREFFAFGPALSDQVVKVRVGDVETTVARRRGARAAPPPPPTEKVRSVLAELADLPAQAEEEARSLTDAQKRIGVLERELRAAQRGAPATDPAALERARAEGRAEGDLAWQARLRGLVADEEGNRRALYESLREARRGMDVLARGLEKAEAAAQREIAVDLEAPAPPRGARPAPLPRSGGAGHGQSRGSGAVAAPQRVLSGAQAGTARSGEARMLSVLAQYAPHGLPEGQWAALAGLKRSGGTWGTYKSRLRTTGYLEERGGQFFATDSGVAAAGIVDALPRSAEEVVALWSTKPGMRAVVPLVEAVLEAGGECNREDVARACGLTQSGGTFSTYLSRARTAGLLSTDGQLVRLGEAFGGF